MLIESISIKNYRVFKNATISNIPKMPVFIGANGSGKSTLFDIFGFLRDALIHNIRYALSKRGGLKEVMTKGAHTPIEIELKFRITGDSPLVTYYLAIGLEDNFPVAEKEILKYSRQPWHFFSFECGKGYAVTNEEDYNKPEAEMKQDYQELESADILAIKGLASFKNSRLSAHFANLSKTGIFQIFISARPAQARRSGSPSTFLPGEITWH